MKDAHDHRLEAGSDSGRIRIVLTITIVYFATELTGGFYANSLALMTDAIHMLTDIAALCMSLFTLWISARPANSDKSYGYLRAEILGALFNGLFLWMLVAFIWFEAAQRLRDPPHVRAAVVIAIGAVGIVVNSISAWLTFGTSRDGHANLAVRAVLIHVISDLIGCAGVVTAGAITYFTGWRAADPLVSFLIGGLIIYGSWGLIRDGVDILMESTPAHIDLERLREGLLAVAGAEEIHDLHVWSLASHQLALSAHAVVAGAGDQDRVLTDMTELIESQFNIHHITLQIERDNRKEREPGHF
ncbi:MAG TPA: cation diffusion facilitator family transporter [Candidatus Binataceae bacterium]|nr:cation diffusion facilitator family transporter [Candidatus Binataceae bacterium]